MHEIAVAATDYLIALECLLLAHLAGRRSSDPSVASLLRRFFLATAVAAAAGGTYHGFFPSEETTPGWALWLVTLLAFGVVSWLLIVLAARLQLAPTPIAAVRTVATVALLLYVGVVTLVSSHFLLAIVAYLPAVLFLAVGLSRRWLVDRAPAAALGLLSLALTLVAAAIQQAEVGLHPLYFNHNALYHAVQAIALWLFFVGRDGLSSAPASGARRGEVVRAPVGASRPSGG